MVCDSWTHTKRAFAYVFGDTLANDELSDEVKEDLLKETTFEVPVDDFLEAGLGPAFKKRRASASLDADEGAAASPSRLEALRARIKAKEELSRAEILSSATPACA